MNQQVEAQLGFAFLEEAETPTLAPIDVVNGFESELDAINYCVDQYVKRHGYKYTMNYLADELKITKQILTKLRQGDVSMPRRRIVRFAEVTLSHAFLQYQAMKSGLVLKTPEQQKEQTDRIKQLEQQKAELQQENADLQESVTAYKRAVGE